jgi:hypothetical protein
MFLILNLIINKFVTLILKIFNYLNSNIFKIYKLIIFLNIMSKIIKSIMIIWLSYVMKKHNLLSRKHFDNRKNIILKHAFHYIVKRIHSTWTNKKVITILLLNVTKIFDNVSHSRLFHNLRKKDINESYLIWMTSFLTKRYIILKLVNYMTRRIKIVIKISQKSFMSSILYVFYNVNLIEWCINLDESIIIVDFIDDINILITKNIAKNNLHTFQTLYQHCDKWINTHDSFFASSKYELIYFRKLFSFFDLKMTLRFLEHDLIFASQCKYLNVIMNN